MLLFDDAGRLLWVRRGLDPGRGLLGLPGGFVDEGESAEAAAVRELREEAGITLDPAALTLLTTLPNRYVFDGMHYPTLDLYYTAALPIDQTACTPHTPEVDAVEWHPPQALAREDLAFSAGWSAVQIWSALSRQSPQR